MLVVESSGPSLGEGVMIMRKPKGLPAWFRSWRVLAILILTCLVMAAGVVWQRWPEDWSFPQLMPAADAAPASIVVGENVQVSKPHEKATFTECIITADPNRPNRLFASSIFFPPGNQGLIGYLSDDGGATWTTTLELIPDPGKN